MSNPATTPVLKLTKLVDLAYHEAKVGALVHATVQRMAREAETMEQALAVEGRDIHGQAFHDAYCRLCALIRLAEAS